MAEIESYIKTGIQCAVDCRFTIVKNDSYPLTEISPKTLELFKEALITADNKKRFYEAVIFLHEAKYLNANDCGKCLLFVIDEIIKSKLKHEISYINSYPFSEMQQDIVLEIFTKLLKHNLAKNTDQQIPSKVDRQTKRMLLDIRIKYKDCSNNYYTNSIFFDNYEPSYEQLKSIIEKHPETLTFFDDAVKKANYISKEQKNKLLQIRIAKYTNCRIMLYVYNLNFDIIKDMLESYPLERFELKKLIDDKKHTKEQNIFVLKKLILQKRLLSSDELTYPKLNLTNKDMTDIVHFAIDNKCRVHGSCFNPGLLIDNDAVLIKLMANNYRFMEDVESYMAKNQSLRGILYDIHEFEENIGAYLNNYSGCDDEDANEALKDELHEIARDFPIKQIYNSVAKDITDNPDDTLQNLVRIRWLRFLQMLFAAEMLPKITDKRVINVLMQMSTLQKKKLKFLMIYRLSIISNKTDFFNELAGILSKISVKKHLVGALVTIITYQNLTAKEIMSLINNIQDFSKVGNHYHTVTKALCDITLTEDLTHSDKIFLLKNIFNFDIELQIFSDEKLTNDYLKSWHKNNPHNNQLLLTKTTTQKDRYHFIEYISGKYCEIASENLPERICSILEEYSNNGNKYLAACKKNQIKSLKSEVSKLFVGYDKIVFLACKIEENLNAIRFCRKSSKKFLKTESPEEKILIIIQKAATHKYALAGTTVDGEKIIIDDLSRNDLTKNLQAHLRGHSQKKTPLKIAVLKTFLINTRNFQLGKQFQLQALIFYLNLKSQAMIEMLRVENLTNYTFKQIFIEAAKKFFDLSGINIKFFWESFSNCHNLNALAMYYKGLDKLIYSEAKMYKALVQKYIKQVATPGARDYYKSRYENNLQVTNSFKALPHLAKLWPKGSTVKLKKFIDEYNITSAKNKTIQQELLEMLYSSVVLNKHLPKDYFPNLYLYLLKSNNNEVTEIPKPTEIKQEYKDMEQAVLLLLETRDSLTKRDILIKTGLITKYKHDKNTSEFYNDLKSFIQIKISASNLKDDLEVIDTGEYWPMFMSGTDVSGSCQRVDGDPDFNMALIGGYVLSGHVRMIAIINEAKIILARAIIKLLTDDSSKLPVLFLERIYPTTISELYKKAITQFAILRGKTLGINVYTLNDNAETKLVEKSLSCATIIGCEYADALEDIQTEPYTIDKPLVHLYAAKSKPLKVLEDEHTNEQSSIPAAALSPKL